MKKICVFLTICFLYFMSTELFAESLTITGGAKSSNESYKEVERDVEKGRTQRDMNTLAPLVPVYEWFSSVMQKGEAYMNSKAVRGSRAVLLCNDKATGVAVSCSTTETNRDCVTKVYDVIRDMGSDIFDVCDVPNPDRHKFFQPDYISRHATIEIRNY
jgi:hypothetical protein